MLCQYCNNSFDSKNSLKKHQKTAKYCLRLREGYIEPEYTCEYCDKVLSQKTDLCSHYKVCKKKEISQLTTQYEKIIDNLQKQIQTLQDKLENIALSAAPRHTTNINANTNNFIQQLDNVTDDVFIESLKHFNIEHIKKGAIGYSEYARNHPLRNRMICTDHSRRSIKYKDENGNVVTDHEMINLSTKLFKSIKGKNNDLIQKFIADLPDTTDPEIRSKMMSNFGDYTCFVNRGANGEKTEMFSDFLKFICNNMYRNSSMTGPKDLTLESTETINIADILSENDIEYISE